MCGIGGAVSLSQSRVPEIRPALDAISDLMSHRGPDGSGNWVSEDESVGLTHRRLSIIDLSQRAAQPMTDGQGRTITYNGEIYNYRELRARTGPHYAYRTESDTEAILGCYEAFGANCLEHFRGMFAFAIWDEREQALFLARDRFGIKPLYHCVVDDTFFFASEAKSLLPLLPQICTDHTALAQYFTFQFTLGSRTLFEGIQELEPGHFILVKDGRVVIKRYWDVDYQIDHEHSAMYFEDRLRDAIEESAELHMRSDVAVGSYVSGGIDSSLVHSLGSDIAGSGLPSFNGRFTDYPGYDESAYARLATDATGATLHVTDITANDFATNIGRVIYHLDFPVAGPGAFPQFMVSESAARHVKVVLGGQGGDEIFGGYARYLLAYLEQCLKAAIEGTYQHGNYVVTLESIIPNLTLLENYKPLMQGFWSSGLFDSMDRRYFRLVDRSSDLHGEILWDELDTASVFDRFLEIFNSGRNVGDYAYFDRMTHFDLKTLLPALLHVEDRMSMAHGIESRVPLLDHPIVEVAATAPANVKFHGGSLKHLLKSAMSDHIPDGILSRRDKMGFPVPLSEWFGGDLRAFATETLQSLCDRDLPYLNSEAILANFADSQQFSRKTWGLLSLELWHRAFHDDAARFRANLSVSGGP